MSHPPSTVKVPASAATYTPATLDPDLRSQINTLLLREGHINKIQDQLLHALDAHSANWPSAVQTHALALLRSGEVSTFPALMRRVLEDVRHETEALASSSSSSSNPTKTDGTAANGATTTTTTTTTNGANNKNGVNGTAAATDGTTATAPANLAIPQAVVDAVLKVARESLESVCELEDGPAGG
ncbi:hypothetical protein F4780DRAFT_240188 [Xylariomycetidae sp. FL0641]|nr:hypothetical protein F4780DRAFT_240188 [Xylariomycetidae sp. FL0641]